MRLVRLVAPLLAAAVLAVAPSTSVAQFGGGMGGRGGIGGRGGGMGGGMGGGRGGMPGAGMRRPEPLINSVDLVLEHGHELALTDSQIVRLTVVKARQDSSLAAVRARLDSLAGLGSEGDGDDPMRRQGRRQERGEAMVAYRDVLARGRDAAFDVLEKKQRKSAEKLEKALKKELEADGPGEGGDGRWPGARRQFAVTHGLARMSPAR